MTVREQRMRVASLQVIADRVQYSRLDESGVVVVDVVRSPLPHQRHHRAPLLGDAAQRDVEVVEVNQRQRLLVLK